MNHRLGAISLFILSMTLSLETMSQIDRSKAPEPTAPPKVELGKTKTFVMDNGMRVIVVENHKLPHVSIQLKFDVEPFLQGDAAGYLDLMGDLLASGTRRFTKQQIDEMVDGAGARLYTSKDGLYLSSLKTHFPKMMDLVYAIATSASFPPLEFENEKKRMRSSVQQRQDDPDAIANDVRKVLTFSKGHPYGEIATIGSVDMIQRKQCKAYYDRFFRPENAYLVFVGDVREHEAKSMAEKYFSTWPNSEASELKDQYGNEIVDGLGPVQKMTKQPLPGGVRRVAFVDRPGAAQSVIKVTFPVELHPADPMAMQAKVMSTILGGGVFNARIMQNLREDKGYTYSAFCSLSPDKYIGDFVATASVRTEVTDSAVTELLYEIEQIQLQPVKAEELELAKNYLAGQFARSLEDPKTVARFELNTYIDGLPQDHYSTYLERLNAVTIEEVQQAAKTFLHPDNAVILVVGDKEKVANKLALLSLNRQVGYYDSEGNIFREKAEAAPAGLDAYKVLDDYVQAIGGKGKLASVRDMTVEATATFQGQNITMRTWNAAPNKYRYELNNGASTMQKVIFNGTQGMRSDPINGGMEPVDLDVYELAQEARLFPERMYKELGNRAILNGIVEIEGKNAYKITVSTVNGNRFVEYYDVGSGLKLRKQETQIMPQGHIQVTVDYKDYRPEEGILMPHLIEQNAGENLTFVVTKVEVNKGVGDAFFLLE